MTLNLVGEVAPKLPYDLTTDGLTLEDFLLFIFSNCANGRARCLRKVRWNMRSAECGVRSAECRKCGVWKMRSVENAECRKCGV